MVEKKPAIPETENRPWRWLELNGTGGAFFAIGIAFVVIGLSSELTFVFVGLSFIFLSFSMKDEAAASRPSSDSPASAESEASDEGGEHDGR